MWSKIPIAPIVFCFSVGIVVSYYTALQLWFWIICGMIMFGAYLMFSKWYTLRYYARWVHTCFYLFWFCLAACLTQFQNPQHQSAHLYKYQFSNLPTAAVVEITDWPVLHNSRLTVPVAFKSVYQKTTSTLVYGNALLKSKYSKSVYGLKPGDVIQVKLRPTIPNDQIHPATFNYNSYLQKHHIYGVFWLDTQSVIYRGTNAFSKLYYGQKFLKQYWIQALKSLKLSADALALCEALTCGYDDEISDTFFEAFSNSGTLHILSVSGLHVGLIFGLMMFVLRESGLIKRIPVFSVLLSLILLWIFILVSGAASPALRAGIMCSAIAIGKYGLGPHRVNTINILFASAWLILISDPYMLFDVGFQLSFSAILGILFMQPLMVNALNIKNQLIHYVWNGITVSVAATITTLPITLFYFKQFPLCFAIANLWAVPLSFIIMLLVLPAFVIPKLIVPVLNCLTVHLYDFLNVFNVSGITYIDNISFSMIDALVLSFIILLSIWLIYSKYYKGYIGIACLIVLWQVFSLLEYVYKLQISSVFINSKKQHTDWAVKHYAKAWTTVSTESADYRFNFKPALLHLGCRNHIQKPFSVFKMGSRVWFFKNHSVLVPGFKYAITDFVISKNALNDSLEAIQFKSAKRIYFTADNSPWFIEKYKRIYRNFDIEIQVLKTGLYEWQSTP
jgi:competence protein ComEC